LFPTIVELEVCTIDGVADSLMRSADGATPGKSDRRFIGVIPVTGFQLVHSLSRRAGNEDQKFIPSKADDGLVV